MVGEERESRIRSGGLDSSLSLLLCAFFFLPPGLPALPSPPPPLHHPAPTHTGYTDTHLVQVRVCSSSLTRPCTIIISFSNAPPSPSAPVSSSALCPKGEDPAPPPLPPPPPSTQAPYTYYFPGDPCPLPSPEVHMARPFVAAVIYDHNPQKPRTIRDGERNG